MESIDLQERLANLEGAVFGGPNVAEVPSAFSGTLAKAVVTQTDDEVKAWPTTGVITLVPAAENKIRIPVFISASLTNPADTFVAYSNLDNLALSFGWADFPLITDSENYDFNEIFFDSDGFYGFCGNCFLEQDGPAFAWGGPAELMEWWDNSFSGLLSSYATMVADPTSMSNKPIVMNVYNNDVPGGGSNDGDFNDGDAGNVVTITVYYLDIDV